MTAPFAGRVPTLWHGDGITRLLTDRLRAGRAPLIIADERVSDLDLDLERHTRGTVRVDASSVTVDTVVAIAREIARRRPDLIVAIGGGTVMDAVKLAALARGTGSTFDFMIERSTRTALTLLPDSPPPVDLIAIPTTIGTSSETNSVAILENDRGYRLVVGRALRPRHAIIDPRNLRTLAPTAAREGVLEAFLRLAGASTSAGRPARARDHAVALGRALLDAAARDDRSAASWSRTARLSAATQRSAALRGPDPYSARHWYVANEVAFALRVRKMAATAAVVAAVWRRIRSGDRRWGDRAALDGFWHGVARGTGLPDDADEGIDALIGEWDIAVPPRPGALEVRRIADAAEEAWGHRLPMLPGVRARDVAEVLRDSRWSFSRSAAPADDRRSAQRR